MHKLEGTPDDLGFLKQVIRRSGQNLLECLQCGKCSGSCPITSEEVSGPRRLIARILGGMKQVALEDATWWWCVACGSCATRCPVEINMYKVATALCEMAAEEGVKPAEPDIHLFEELFLKSVEKFGRILEVRTVMSYNLRTGQPLKDWNQGLKMVLSGAISPFEMLKRGPKNETVSKIVARIRKPEEGSDT